MESAPLGATTPAFLTKAPDDLAGWVRALDERDLPVLADTAQLIEDLRSVEDDVDAHMIADGIVEDPLMTLKVLRHVARLPRPDGRTRTDPDTVTEALVMLGITPFFRDCGSKSVSVEQHLAAWTAAQHGLHKVLKESRRAARFALGFAVHRQDHDAAVIHAATLLHELAQTLVWLHAPTLALDLANQVHCHTHQSAADAQRAILNIDLAELQHALIKIWRLPDLLARLGEDQATEHPQVRNVQLAVRIARNSADGWQYPTLSEDVDAVCQLLSLGHTPSWNLLRDLDS